MVEEHFHCDGPEQEQTDRQVGGNYHWAVELEQGPHGLPLALTVPWSSPSKIMAFHLTWCYWKAVVSPPLHSGMIKPFYLYL